MTTSLVDCDIDGDEVSKCPPTDYGSWHLYGPLGMANITDFEHYHYNPEASEMSAPLTIPRPPLLSAIWMPHHFPRSPLAGEGSTSCAPKPERGAAC